MIAFGAGSGHFFVSPPPFLDWTPLWSFALSAIAGVQRAYDHDFYLVIFAMFKK